LRIAEILIVYEEKAETDGIRFRGGQNLSLAQASSQVCES
jgi:hypothetical protein